MAFHDDVDDANDANDKTSSEHEFELPFPRRAASGVPAANSASDGDDSTPVDLSEASTGGVFDLDAEFNLGAEFDLDTALGLPASPDVAAPVDLPPPPSASSFAPIDLNDEFERSDLSEGLDQGKPPWAMAPAPDPTQAVSQLEAPDGLSDEQRTAAGESDDAGVAQNSGSFENANTSDADDASVDDFAPKSAAATHDDPYQIPVDYTTPDFFASRISRRRVNPDENDLDNTGENAPTENAPTESASAESAEEQASPVDVPAEPFDERGPQVDEFADSAEPEDARDFDFDSLFATAEPDDTATPMPVGEETAADGALPLSATHLAPTDDSLATNNVWKLGPLEPNVQAGAPGQPVDSDEATVPESADAASAELPPAIEEVIEGAPMWNLDGVDAPEAASAAGPNGSSLPASASHFGGAQPVEFPADAFAAAAAEFAPQAEASSSVDDQSEYSETSAAAGTVDAGGFLVLPEVSDEPSVSDVADEPEVRDVSNVTDAPDESELFDDFDNEEQEEPFFTAPAEPVTDSVASAETAHVADTADVADIADVPESTVAEIAAAGDSAGETDVPDVPDVPDVTDAAEETDAANLGDSADTPVVSSVAPSEEQLPVVPSESLAAPVEAAAPADTAPAAETETTADPELAVEADFPAAAAMPVVDGEQVEPAETDVIANDAGWVDAPFASAASESPSAATTTERSESETAESPASAEPTSESGTADDTAIELSTEHVEAPELSYESEIPAPPVRRSMADDELLNWADNPENQSTGTLSVIEVLEAQLRLREEEAREYREWETTLRSKAAPLHEESVESVPVEERPSSDESPTEPVASTEPTAAASPAAPETVAEPVAPETVAAAQLPAWDVPPPSDTWAPGDDFDDEIPFAAHADPTGAITLPVFDDEPAIEAHTDDAATAFAATESSTVDQSAADGSDSPSDATSPTSEFAAAAPEHVQENAAPDVPEAETESAAEPVGPHFDAESGLLSLDEILPMPAPAAPPVDESGAAAAGRFASSPQFPADEDGDYDEIPFTPPPLVEPTTAPSTPRANLDEYVSFGDFGFTPPITGEPEAGDEASASATAAASDTDTEAPFAFDLDSTPTSAAAEFEGSDPDLADSASTDLAAGDDETTSAGPQAESDAGPVAFNFASQETPRYVPAAPVSFDDLLKTAGLDEAIDEPEADEDNPLDAFLAEPQSDAAPASGALPESESELVQQNDPLAAVQTGSFPIAQAAFEEESDEAVDPSDRRVPLADQPDSPATDDSNPIPFAAAGVGTAVTAGAAAAATQSASGVAAAPTSAAIPSVTDSSAVPQPMPLSTAMVSQQPLGLDDVAPTAQRVFSLEESGLEPTPIDRRIGHAARLFWLWFAANSSIISIGLGAAVFAVGMSLRQSVVAILAGVALSFIPLGLTTLAGKRSGQPTMVISRSAFGLIGNVVPSVIALIARLFWGAVLLWVLASSVAIVLIGSDMNVGLGDRQILLLALALSFLVALVIAFAGYPLFARIQLILSIISGLLVVGLIVFTAQYIDVSQALATPDGSWLLTVTGAVLVFSFLGLVWAYSGADIARYQRPSSSGAASALSAAFGATLPAFVLIAYGALLAASDPAIARGFLASPLDTLLLLLPGWYPIPLLLAAGLSLLSGITLSLYSGGFALQAVGVRLPRQWSIVIVGVLLGALAVLFAFGVDGGINELFRDVATTLAVPTAAWVGIFAAETMIRTRRLDSAALTTRGGIYPDFRWGNLSAFIVISAVGFALTSATIGWLSWQGYGFVALGIDLSSELAATDLGVLVALVLGILTPIVAGIPAIRRQEAGSPDRAARPA